MKYELGRVYIVVSVQGVPTVTIYTITNRDIKLLDRIGETGATIREKRPFKVHFAYH